MAIDRQTNRQTIRKRHIGRKVMISAVGLGKLSSVLPSSLAHRQSVHYITSSFNAEVEDEERGLLSLSLSLPACLSLPVCLSLSLPVYLCLCVSVCLSVSVSLSLSPARALFVCLSDILFFPCHSTECRDR